MERESDKHNPRLDEEMKRETASLEQGQPAESRVDENREAEPPGEGEPQAVRAPSTDAGAPDTLSPAEIEARHELARFIEGAAFPGTPQQLLQSAEQMHAPHEIIDRLRSLPERVYENVADVWTTLGGRMEPAPAPRPSSEPKREAS